MLRVFKHAVAPAVSIGYPGNSKHGPLLQLQMSDALCTFCKNRCSVFSSPASPPAHLLPLLFLSLQNTASGSDVRAHLRSLGVISRGFLPFLLTGDYWGVLVKRPWHNSNHFPTFFRGCTRWTGIISVSPFRWNLEEIPTQEVTHLTPV